VYNVTCQSGTHLLVASSRRAVCQCGSICVKMDDSKMDEVFEEEVINIKLPSIEEMQIWDQPNETVSVF